MTRNGVEWCPGQRTYSKSHLVTLELFFLVRALKHWKPGFSKMSCNVCILWKKHFLKGLFLTKFPIQWYIDIQQLAVRIALISLAYKKPWKKWYITLGPFRRDAENCGKSYILGTLVFRYVQGNIQSHVSDVSLMYIFRK